MALQGSGVIRFSDIQAEMGGTGVVRASDYYKGGSYTTDYGTCPVPSSGKVTLANFYGAKKNPCNTGAGWGPDYSNNRCTRLGGVLDVQLTASSGTWTVPEGITDLVVMKVDGGRGGEAKGSAQYCSEICSTSKCGTCNSCTSHVIPTVQNITVTPGEQISYSIGGGGSGKHYGSNSTQYAVVCGDYGGTTTFGSYMTSPCTKSSSNSGASYTAFGESKSYTPTAAPGSHQTDNPGSIYKSSAGANTGGYGGSTSTWYSHTYSAHSGDGGSGRITVHHQDLELDDFSNL